jgi:hypothetical protein
LGLKDIFLLFPSPTMTVPQATKALAYPIFIILEKTTLLLLIMPYSCMIQKEISKIKWDLALRLMPKAALCPTLLQEVLFLENMRTGRTKIPIITRRIFRRKTQAQKR